MRSLLLLTVGALFLAPSASSAGSFFPLRAGNTWTYREAKTGHEWTVRIGTPVMTNDLVYYSLFGYVEKRLLVRVNELNELVYLDEDSGKEYLLTSFEPSEYGWWQASFRVCDQEGQAQPKRVTHEGRLGPIDGVLDVRYRAYSCADAGVVSEKFAENLGMIERTVQSIAGPRVYELVEARVGAVQVDVDPRARFSVSTARTPRSETLQVTLRLEANGTLPLPLTFDSAQEYEVEVLNPQGSVEYRWSDGQFFAAAVHERSVDRMWTVKLEIPWSERGQPVAVRAWLTTAGGVRYAASVLVPVLPE